jgi:hypothetical protein
MNRDSVLDLARDLPLHPHIRRPRRGVIDDLRGLRWESNAAVADFRGLVPASVDHDLLLFLVYERIPRVGWVRTRLRKLVRRRPESLVIERDGKDRR